MDLPEKDFSRPRVIPFWQEEKIFSTVISPANVSTPLLLKFIILSFDNDSTDTVSNKIENISKVIHLTCIHKVWIQWENIY